METKKIQKTYTKILKLVKDMPAPDFYNLLASLEKGYEAYLNLDLPEDIDDIEEIEDDLDD